MYYLGVIASFLSKTKEFEVCFSFLGNDNRRPMIVLKHLLEKVVIRLIPSIPTTLFPSHKLAPNRNNVRPTLMDLERTDTPPTPLYNSSILMDSTIIPCLSYVYNSIGKSNSVKEGLKLVKVWLKQRGLNQFSHLMTMICAWLVETKRVSLSFSSFQVFKVLIDILANKDFNTFHIVMTPDSQTANLEIVQSC